jgi:hypothetical protein
MAVAATMPKRGPERGGGLAAPPWPSDAGDTGDGDDAGDAGPLAGSHAGWDPVRHAGSDVAGHAGGASGSGGVTGYGCVGSSMVIEG